ncbi:hypothetical protein BHE18_02240 [Rossellomorea aquimaris]|uniref:Uncharacterized protein n=1 Tax=Rossellomorea aquimaris TaxID=189382 RepID=A0A1J6WV58_9BACI|nr:hypothetical protein BHE18_02240 [Rossellomorea aquimaris]
MSGVKRFFLNHHEATAENPFLTFAKRKGSIKLQSERDTPYESKRSITKQKQASLNIGSQNITVLIL